MFDCPTMSSGTIQKNFYLVTEHSRNNATLQTKSNKIRLLLQTQI